MCISLEKVKLFSSYQVLKSNQESPKGNLLTSEIFGNLQKYEACFTENDVIYDKSQFPLKIEIFYKPYKI